MAFSRFLKALIDRLGAALGLVLTSPLLLVCAAAIVLESGWPVFYRQTRVGWKGRPFQIIKFRSMRSGVSGSRITASGDPRVTRVGGFLRRYKLDELPQLWNVLKGEMSFVGPRPELPDFVDLNASEWQTVLSVRPGITDLATLLYRNEETLLGTYRDTDRGYREVVLPAKLAVSIAFTRTATLWTECKLIACTVYYSFFPGRFDSDRVLRVLSIAKSGLASGRGDSAICSSDPYR